MGVTRAKPFRLSTAGRDDDESSSSSSGEEAFNYDSDDRDDDDVCVGGGVAYGNITDNEWSCRTVVASKVS